MADHDDTVTVRREWVPEQHAGPARTWPARLDPVRPDAARPDAARPDAARPDAARPTAARPEAAAPNEPATRAGAAAPQPAGRHEAVPEQPGARPMAAPQPAGRHEAAAPQHRPGSVPVVSTRGLGLRTRRGWVFRGVDLDVYPGELIALTGPSGSGRTSLLLAVAGRFATNQGTLARHGGAALGYVPDVSEPEPGLTVAEHVEERLLLLGRLRWRHAARQEAVDAALAGYPLEPDRLIRNVDAYHRHLLGLLLAELEKPSLIVVDDADGDLSTAERSDLWARLRTVAGSGVAVIATCREVDPRVPDRIITLEAHR